MYYKLIQTQNAQLLLLAKKTIQDTDCHTTVSTYFKVCLLVLIYVFTCPVRRQRSQLLTSPTFPTSRKKITPSSTPKHSSASSKHKSSRTTTRSYKILQPIPSAFPPAYSHSFLVRKRDFSSCVTKGLSQPKI